MSIRIRLVALVIGVLLPALVAVAWGIHQVYEGEERDYEARVRDTARALALVVDRELERRVALLSAMAGSPDLVAGDLARFHAHARRVVPSNENTIVLIDPQGRQLLNTRLPYGTAPLPRSSLPPGDEPVFISDLYLAPVGRQWSFAVRIPVEYAGQPGYALALGSFASQLQAVFAEQGLQEPWTGAILDRTGRIVARNNDPGRHVGEMARDDLREHAAREPEGSFATRTRDGREVLAIFARAPKSGWTFAIGVPREVVTATAMRGAAWTAVMAALVLGIGIPLALWIGRSIVRPVQSLADTAAAMGRGERVAHRPSGLDEVDRASAAFAAASERIASAREEMQTRVEQAVAESQRSQQALLQAQKLEALGRLTGGIAHDFNNLLQTLGTGLHVMAMRGGDAPEVQGAVASCRRAVDRATRLTRQLMAFARRQPTQPQAIDVRNQLLTMGDLLRNAVQGGVELRFDIEEALWPVRADPLQLELALLNVAINARDAMPGGGSLTIGARNVPAARRPEVLAPGDYVQIALRDTGTGMSEEVRAKALDPFFTTKEVGKGSGLGLPQAYGFAAQSGGTLAIDSAPGAGTTVSVFLPRSAVAPASEGRGGADAAQPFRGEVLVVEDDALVREIVVPALRGFGFGVASAASAEEALALLRDGHRADVVFSDVVMPGMDGVELAREIGRRYPGTPVVLATGYSERADMQGWRTLAKPYDVHAAAAALAAACRGTRA